MLDMFLSWFLLFLIPKNETESSYEDGQAERKNIPIAKEVLPNHILKEIVVSAIPRLYLL